MGWTVTRPWGGNFTDEPTVVSWGAGRLDVFARGTDGGLHHWWGDDDRWGGPEPIGSPKAWPFQLPVMAGPPTAVTWGPRRLDVFARGFNGSLMHWWFDGSGWSGPESRGGLLTGNPSAVSWGPERLHVFARSITGELLRWWLTASGWSGPVSWGGAFDGSPHAVSWGPGRLDVFGRGRDQTLQHWWFEQAWDPPEPLGGRLEGDPHAVAWGPGRLDVFGRGRDQTLQHWWFEQSWQHQPLAGGLSGRPYAASWSPGRLDVFGRGTNAAGTLQHWWFNAQGWQGPEDLMGAITGAPTAASWGPDRLDVFARGWTGRRTPVDYSEQLQHWDFDVGHDLTRVRPSLVFDEPGLLWMPGGIIAPNDNAKGYWASEAIVARDVTLAGWLMSSPENARGFEGGWHFGDTGHEHFGAEDWHYNIWLDPNFIDTYYDNHLGPLNGAVLRGNEKEVRLGWRQIPLVAGRPTADTFILPAQGLQDPKNERPFGHFTIELNAWHTMPTPPGDNPAKRGRGPAPDGWVPDPDEERFCNNWFPFNTRLGADARAAPLKEDDYVIIRGTLWQDSSHGTDPDLNPRTHAWDNAFPNHAGWLEIHPVDSIRRAPPPPGPRKDVQVVSLCVPPGKVRTQSFDVCPELAIGTPNEWETLWYTELIDPRFTRQGQYIHAVEQHRDRLRVHVTCWGLYPGWPPVRAGTFKATYLLWWGPIMM